jgi:hypothetical protein
MLHQFLVVLLKLLVVLFLELVQMVLVQVALAIGFTMAHSLVVVQIPAGYVDMKALTAPHALIGVHG